MLVRDEERSSADDADAAKGRATSSYGEHLRRVLLEDGAIRPCVEGRVKRLQAVVGAAPPPPKLAASVCVPVAQKQQSHIFSLGCPCCTPGDGTPGLLGKTGPMM